MARRVINTDYESVAVTELSTHPRNARRGDLGAVCASIEAHGFFGALVVQRSTKFVLAGNHRLMAARQLGYKELPVTWVDVDDEQALRILVADNRTSDLGNYDDEILVGILKDLAQNGGLDGLGYDGDDLDALINDANFDPLPPGSEARLDQKNPVTCPECSAEFVPA